MKQRAQRVSTKKDNKTFCLPSEGYQIEVEIELEREKFEEITTLIAELPESDLSFPKGAPLTGYFKIENKIYKMK